MKNMSEKPNKAHTEPVNISQEKSPEQIEQERIAAEEVAKKEEQERTTKAKVVFLDAYERSMGIITVACQKANVGRTTFYEWKRDDPHFLAEVERVNDMMIDYSEDQLKKAIVKGNLKGVLFHLGRMSPKYKAKIESVVKDERTLEDLIDDAAAAEEKENGNTDTKKVADGQPNADAIPALDQKQAGAKGEVPAEQGADVLPTAPITQKPDIESTAKGSDGVH